ncbi:MAG TPA: HAD-IA family hydrolase [Dermatophilaceae bacterium]|nr:HAD-IA family hydrolase [Dermatophilaceae bacterium]
MTEPDGPAQVVLFDADGVLQLPLPTWAAEVAAFAGTDHPAERERFVREVQQAETSAYLGDVDFATVLAELLRRWGLGHAPAEVLATWTRITVEEAVLTRVDALVARGVRCAVATNQHRERAAYMRAELGHLDGFEAVFVSSDLGLAKPDPAFFRHVVRALDVNPAEVLFVDDMAVNVEAARAVGLRAEVFAHGGGVAELDRILALHGLA